MVESLPQDRAVEGSNPCPPFGKDNNEEYGYGLSEDMSYHFVANLLKNCQLKNLKKIDSGSFKRAVTSDTRGLRYKSRHQQNFILNIFSINC